MMQRLFKSKLYWFFVGTVWGFGLCTFLYYHYMPTKVVLLVPYEEDSPQPAATPVQQQL